MTHTPIVVANGAYLLESSKKFKQIRGKRHSKPITVFSSDNYVDEHGRTLKPYLFQENGRNYAWFKYDTPSLGYSAEFLAPVITREEDPSEDPHVDYVVVPIINSKRAAKSKHYGEFLKKNAYPQTAPGLEYASYNWHKNQWGKNDLYGDLQPKLNMGSGQTQWLEDNSGVTEQRSRYVGESPKVLGDPIVDHYDLGEIKQMDFVTHYPPVPQHIGTELSKSEYSPETSSRINHIRALLQKAKEALEASVGNAKHHAGKASDAAKAGGKVAVTYATPIVKETAKGAAKGAIREGIKGAGQGIKQSVSSTEGPITATSIATNVAVEGATGAAIGGLSGGAEGFSKGVKKAQDIRKNEKAKNQSKPHSSSPLTTESETTNDDYHDHGAEEYQDEEAGGEEETNQNTNSSGSQKISAQLDRPDGTTAPESTSVPVSLTDSYIEKTKANIAQQRMEQSQMDSSASPSTEDETSTQPQNKDEAEPMSEDEDELQEEEQHQQQQSQPVWASESPYEMWNGLKPWRGDRPKDDIGMFPDRFVKVPNIPPEMFRTPPGGRGNKDFSDRVINIQDSGNAFKAVPFGTTTKIVAAMGSEYDNFHNMNYSKLFSQHPRPYDQPHVARAGHDMMVVVIQPVGDRVMSISAEAKTEMNRPASTKAGEEEGEEEEEEDGNEKEGQDSPAETTTPILPVGPQRAHFKEKPIRYFDQEVCQMQGFKKNCLDEYRRQQRMASIVSQ